MFYLKTLHFCEKTMVMQNYSLLLGFWQDFVWSSLFRAAASGAGFDTAKMKDWVKESKYRIKNANLASQ